jgi:hypothetical protein
MPGDALDLDAGRVPRAEWSPRRRGPADDCGRAGDGAAGVTPSDRFIIDKATIRAELEQRARARRTITYSEAAILVGRSPRGLSAILDAIEREEAACGHPDLGTLVVNVLTRLPTYARTDPAGRARAIAVQEAVFAAWAEA